MKKIISICLSVILILGLMPQAFATVSENQVTVSTTGITTVEAEDYPYTKGTIQQTEGGTVNDANPTVTVEGEYLKAQLYSTTAFDRTLYWEYKFVITQAGEYNIKTRVGKPWRYRFHGMHISFGDSQISSISGWDNTTTGDAVTWDVFEKEITLEPGTYTFKVETDEGTGGNHMLFVDYVSVEYIPEVIYTVPESGTKIQAEDLKVKRSVDSALAPLIVTDGSADGGKYLDSNYGQITNCVTSVEAKLNVLSAGLYDISIKAKQIANESGYTFSVDDGTAITFSSGTDETEWKIYKTSAYLTAGEHIIKLSSVGRYGHCRLVADYIELSPGGIVDVSEFTETVIEAEDYAYSFLDNNGTVTFRTGTVKNDIASASGGEYLFADQGGSIEGALHYWEITLDISQAGIYEIKSLISDPTRYRFNSVKIMLGDETLYETSTDWPGIVDVTFEEKAMRKYLSEGQHTYRFYAGKAGNGNQQLYLDALKIKPVLRGSSDPDVTGFYFGYEAEVFAETSISVSYTYQGTNPEGNSVLRLMYRDWTPEWRIGETVIVSGGTGEITLPDSLVGREIKVEFYPVDNTGVMGPLFSENIGVLQRAIYISPTLTKNTTSSRYEASVDIEFNSLTMPLPQVLIIIAQYDASGAMVGYTPLYVDDMARNYNRTKTLNAPFVSGATSATLFVWSGTSVTGTVDKAYTDTVTQ